MSPRGNDSRTALADLRGQYSGASGNAEELIEAVRSSITPELRAAQLGVRDDEASKDIEGRLDEVQKKVPDGEVVGAAVRGDWVIALVKSDEGRIVKVPIPHSEFGGKGKAVAEELSDEEQARRAESASRMQLHADAAAAQRDAEEASRKAAEGAAKKSAPAKK